MFSLRKTINSDIKDILNIYDEAKNNMNKNNIYQWNNGYPSVNDISNDILNKESFVFTLDGKIVATAMISEKQEITYNIIKGKWNSSDSYIVIHRFTVDTKNLRRGIASKFLEHILENFNNKTIRIDTHKDNYLMKNFLIKNGFKYCGIINLLNGEEREAYDKVNKNN